MAGSLIGTGLAILVVAARTAPAEEAQQLASPPVLSADERATIAGLPVVPAGLNGWYTIDVQPVKKIKAVYTCKVHAPNLTATEWTLFIPRPPDLKFQKILDTKTSPTGTIISDLSPDSRPLFQIKTQADDESLKKQFELQWVVEAQLFSRKLNLRPGKKSETDEVARLTDEERALALRDTRNFDYSSDSMRTWMNAADIASRQSKEGEVNFARRVFQAIANKFQYEYLGNQDRTASHVCQAGKSDCGGLCTLFVAAMRSQGIPARCLVGRWAKSAEPRRDGSGEYLQGHVKAEFFAQGVGWVPVDPSLAVQYDKSPQKLKHFGNDPGNFLVLHVDYDLTFDTESFGKHTRRALQGAAYWAQGSGTFDGKDERENWQVN